MNQPATLPRPRQVTMAAWIIIGGSLLVVLTAFDRIAGLNSLDTREAVELFLAEPPGNGLGLSVGEVLATVRVLSMVAGACAAAAAILGFHVLRRHQGARIALSVLAVPLFLTGLATGGFLSSLVAASALMLWLEPARDWFAGRPAKEQPSAERAGAERAGAERAGAERAGAGRPEAQPRQGHVPGPSAPAAPPASTGPRPHRGFGSPTASGAAPATGPASPQVHAPYAPPQQWGPPPPRPGAVVAAAVVTWVMTALVSLMLAISIIAVLVSPDLMMEEALKANPSLGESDLTAEALQLGVVVVAGVGLAWSIAAAVFAALLVVRRREWARISLLISSAAAVGVCLLMAAVGGFPMLVPLVASSVTFWLLLRRDVRAWVAAP